MPQYQGPVRATNSASGGGTSRRGHRARLGGSGSATNPTPSAGGLGGGVAADRGRSGAAGAPRTPERGRPRPAAEADAELVALTGPWYWGTHAFALRL
ncbi:hypothetical protein PUR28_01935, partial [Streptomyces sp. BE308]|nr:hypothetical protein [Streptomyces sp. BE308]